jgi:hypothetical protein
LLAEPPDLSQATAAIANRNIANRSGCWVMKTPPGLSSFLIYCGKKYATVPVISSPGLCPTFSLPALAAPISRPKAGTVGEGRMAELGRESMIERMLAMNTAADRTD